LPAAGDTIIAFTLRFTNPPLIANVSSVAVPGPRPFLARLSSIGAALVDLSWLH
jgi:hypothetical protein